MGNEVLEGATKSLVSYLEHLYEGWEGVKQFGETPGRLVRSYEEFCWPPEKIEKELDKAFRVFDNGYNELLTVKDIKVWTLCPHHLLPCQFMVSIGYIPDGSVLGLSKFARIAKILAKRPIMQEEYTTELAGLLMAKLKPQGVAVYCTGTLLGSG